MINWQNNECYTTCLAIRIANINSPQAANAWLAQQSEQVCAVTQVTEDGKLVQRPVISDDACVDPTARLIGGMIIRENCYVGPFAVVRLDEKSSPEPLILGRGSNIQDCAVVHATTQSIGERVIVAHQAIVHGAIVEDDVTIYIQAVVDGGGTVIGRGSFCHQGSYIGKGLRIPPERYIAPGQKVLSQSEADRLPEVPSALREIQNHVLELNLGHVERYRKVTD